MEINLHLVLAIEIIIVNMLVVHIASNRRFPPRITFLSLGIFSMGLIFLNKLLLDNFTPHSGAFLAIGFLYLIPYRYLYNQPLKYSFAITCTTWLYSLFMFSLSVRIASILNQEWFEWVIIVAQTLFYLVTLPPFVNTLHKARYALLRIKDETLTVFILLGSVWFLACILLNILFEGYGSSRLELLVTLLLLFCTILSYKLFYSLILVSNAAKELTRRTKTDALTGLKNRDAFLSDAQRRIEGKCPFSIVFIDLDRFKQVNDNYGHAEGDQYLIYFTKVLGKYCNGKGTLYRLSGDEFVLLYLRSDIEMFCSQLEAKISSTFWGRIQFQGMSLGYASYPKDGEDLKSLLKLADHNMYQNKKVKHMVRDLDI